jgi:glycosyltransferase involved in cell wall biosynthesis
MPFLPRTLESIRAQTYGSWRVLAWDNGSTDGTAGELRRWIPDRLPGRVITGRPLPLAESRAALVLESPTELCAWIDADDLNAPERLELQVRFLVANPDVAAVGGQIRAIVEDGTLSGRTRSFAIDDHEIVSDMLDGPGLAQPAVLFRRSAVLSVGNYRNVGPVNVEDYDLWLRLAAVFRLANLPEVVLDYRVHEGSTTVRARRTGALHAAVRDRFAIHAPDLFGCSDREARLLAANRHPFALPVLIRMAHHLRERSGRSAWRSLRSGRFGQKALALLWFGDLLTFTTLAAMRARPRRQFRSLTRATLARSLRALGLSGRAGG